MDAQTLTLRLSAAGGRSVAEFTLNGVKESNLSNPSIDLQKAKALPKKPFAEIPLLPLPVQTGALGMAPVGAVHLPGFDAMMESDS